MATELLTMALTRAVRAVTSQVEGVLKSEGLSLDQWLVLGELADERGLTMADLAARTMTTGPTLSRVVDRLVTTALVYREVDMADRRKVRVYLSPRGKSRHMRAAVKVDEVERRLLDGIGDPDAILRLLGHLAR